ncbi:hypothetical protein [Halorubrum sp. PV6]|uniref:hypothetical protein n=1 Tax=Halorubrum sp. PV6 TaxID=634157 RepID=UPI001B354FCD|nr:hypothetical protein [Halorubrum sp. PV6]
MAVVQASFLYQWLTAEPDPEVIVIDLRETWTVGPILRLLDIVIHRLRPAVKNAGVLRVTQRGFRMVYAAPLAAGGVSLAIGGLLITLIGVMRDTMSTTQLAVGLGAVLAGIAVTRDRRSWDTLRETRPVELLVAALEPPDPPTQTDSSDTEIDSGGLPHDRPDQTDATAVSSEHSTKPESPPRDES